MIRSTFLLAAALAMAALAPIAEAQMRPDRGFFLQGRAGAALYGGDADDTETDGNTENGGTGETGFGEYFRDAGFGAGGELGYQISPRISLALAYQYGQYPEITGVSQVEGQLPGQAPQFIEVLLNEDDAVHEAQLRLRFLMNPRWRVSPYLTLGGSLAFITPASGDVNLANLRAIPLYNEVQPGQTQSLVEQIENAETESIAYGPLGGLGVDIRLARRISLFLEGDVRLFFPDDGIDRLSYVPGSPETVVDAITQEDGPIEDLDFDILGALGGGLRFDFSSPMIPVDCTIDGPTSLVVNESGTYTGFVNNDASGPISYRWDFGDGGRADGLTAGHAFAAPGTYTVSLTCAGPINTDTETLLVTVVPPPVVAVAPVLTNCLATPNPAGIGESVRFSASVSGTDPVTYRYDFGDGQTASTLNANNAYAAAGTYTATLTATNEMGSDQCTVVVTVVNRRCENVTELNTVYFGYRSAALSAEANTRLDENVAVLRECPTVCVTINGYSDDRESDKVRLSERRAQSVAAYYTSMGISEDRLRARGLGEAPDSNSKEDPGQGDRNARRAESIPQNCATFMNVNMDQ